MAVSSYTGTLPNPRTQTPTDLNTNMDDFINWLVENAPEIYGHVAELVALASVAAYSSTTTYSLYQCVYGTDGHTYRCIQACTGVSPGVTSGWESYWFQLTIEPGPELASGVYLTGNIQGGNYYKASGTTITVEAGRCVDDTDKYWIEWAEQTITVTVPSWPAPRHLFACSDGVIRDDSDVDGSNLSAYIKRYIGRFYSDHLGVTVGDFYQNGDLFAFPDYSESHGQSLTTSYVDYSSWFVWHDIERISEIEITASCATSGAVASISIDGTNDAYTIGRGTSTGWGDTVSGSAGLKPMPPDGTMYAKVSSGTSTAHIRTIRMKR